jgi:hypothetical protein
MRFKIAVAGPSCGQGEIGIAESTISYPYSVPSLYGTSVLAKFRQHRNDSIKQCLALRVFFHNIQGGLSTKRGEVDPLRSGVISMFRRNSMLNQHIQLPHDMRQVFRLLTGRQVPKAHLNPLSIPTPI